MLPRMNTGNYPCRSHLGMCCHVPCGPPSDRGNRRIFLWSHDPQIEPLNIPLLIEVD